MKIKSLILSVLFVMLFTTISFAETTYSLQEVNKHNTPEDCWMIFEGSVYDFTKYLPSHDVYMDIREWCGKDMTIDFKTKAGEGRDHRPMSYSLLESYKIGTYNSDSKDNQDVSSTSAEDYEEEYAVEVSGQEMKNMTVQEIANLWKIDADVYLSVLKTEFHLTQEYTVEDTLDALRNEYKFSPSQAKDVAQNIADGVINEVEDSPVADKVVVAPQNPYNFMIPFAISIVVYTGWFLLTKTSLNKKNKIFTRIFFNMFWNTVLLLTVTIPGLIFGFLMVIKYNKPKLANVFNYEFIYYWHVELSVVMATIALAHFVNRFVLYKNQLKVSFKKK